MGEPGWIGGRPIAPGGPLHVVQFYESEDYLCGLVSEFVGDGLGNGEPAVIIATEPHRVAFASLLAAKGFDVDGAVASGRLRFCDARETLDSFMCGAMPDVQQFRTTVGGVIAAASRNSNAARVRAYGEMVHLLWRDGNPEGAIRLEELWNELAALHTFALLCAYPMGNFYKESDAPLFARVCRTHGLVVPTERYTEAPNEATRAVEISLLQQQAEALRTEIAHRKELETALRDALAARRSAESELKDFVQHAPIGMHWVGPDGTILWANDAELQLLGYTAEEYIGRNIADFHADKALIADTVARLFRNEQIRDCEASLVAKDGSIRHVSINSNARFENGRFFHTRCFTRDVTDRKHLEEERRRAGEDNAFLLEVTTSLLGSLDHARRVRELSELLVPRVADWCAVEVTREGVRERVTAGPAALAPAEPIAGNSDTHVVAPLCIGERIVGTLTLVRAERPFTDADMTLIAELTRRAALALENARLYELAQRANRTKDEFLATLSHELRTPLTAILGWARMLSLGGLDPETTRTAYDTIERSARAQATLIDDLLDLSKVVTGKLTLRRELVDLSTAIENAVQAQRLAAEGKGIQLDISGTDERAVVTGDPTRLQQIIWNLLSNAIKFSDAGSRVSLALERADDVVRLIVRDTGRGISNEFLPHVFEAFRQEDGANTRKHGGLGLGLAIVKYLTELHGGTVQASSGGEGHGSTFVVTLPLALRRSLPAEPAENLEQVDLSGVSILLVDDDRDTRELVTAILRRYGAEVEAADSVRSACEALHRKRPHVVVTDISMPERDGVELLNV
ncbi:MAG TPA: ATP-binding protein, partial [Thermoanaerobaculia bacterium]|nr:ATP-binding protein [Thermoanaerobaculia bacterium]